jgi:hypothetical protein
LATELELSSAPKPLSNTNHTASMPKSKRAKVVHLSKVDKHGKELSIKLFTNVQEAADNFQHIFVFSVENMRNSYLKAVRAEFADSRYARPLIFRKAQHLTCVQTLLRQD